MFGFDIPDGITLAKDARGVFVMQGIREVFGYEAGTIDQRIPRLTSTLESHQRFRWHPR